MSHVWFFLCFLLFLHVNARQPLSNEQADHYYPRAIVLSHQTNASNNGLILAAVTSFSSPINSGINASVGAIFGSRNNGASFTRVGTVRDPDAASKNLAIGTVIFELNSKVGNMPAGTILWSGVIGKKKDHNMAIKLWQSPDAGVTWKFVSTIAVADPKVKEGGLWEPEFIITPDGQLVCHFSDETLQPKHSQVLQQVFSKDGITWSKPQLTVAPRNPDLRPGMSVVRQLTPSFWIMTFEVCGRKTKDGKKSKYDCGAAYKTSTDGKNWGDPAKVGAPIKDNQNRFLLHTPNIAFSPSTGVLVAGAQMLVNRDGAVDAGNGATLFRTNINLKGWEPFEAPVKVPNARDNICPNYSPALLFLDNGMRLLEVATDCEGKKMYGVLWCTKYVNSAHNS